MRSHAEYKDVNQRWLQSIPVSWSTTRLRYVCDIGTGSGDTVNAEPEGDYPFIVRSPVPLRATTFDHEGEAILTVGDGAVGEVFHHIRDGRFLAHQRVYVLRNFRGIDGRFLFYYFSSLFRYMAQDGSARTTVDSVRRWMLTDMPVAVPPLDEQRAIADYLDLETARIDTLIEEQQRLIEMLRERRESAVTHALTAGISREPGVAPTGDSWLPVLPNGWKAIRTKQVLSFGPTNGVSPESGAVGDLRTLSLACIAGGRVRMDEGVTKYVDRASVPNFESLRLCSGDILIVRGNGNVRLVARAGLVGAIFDNSEYIYPDLLIRIRTNSLMIPEFFVRAFDSSATRSQIESLARTAVGTFKVSAADVRSIVLPLPPLDEQRRIVTYLDEQTAKIDTLIAETVTFIELARERRAALIAAAVNGQIDVRDAA